VLVCCVSIFLVVVWCLFPSFSLFVFFFFLLLVCLLVHFVSDFILIDIPFTCQSLWEEFWNGLVIELARGEGGDVVKGEEGERDQTAVRGMMCFIPV